MRVHPADDQSDRLNDSEWIRISEAFAPSKGNFSLWGSTEISPRDTLQGYLGDCWILSAASAIAIDPEKIKKLFLTDHLNSAGVYALNMYVMGVPVTVTVDEYLPFFYNDPTALVYAKAAVDGALWMPILEKAAAKLFGNYEMLSGGMMGPAIQTLTGSPFFNTWHDEISVDALWDLMDSRFAKGWMVTAGSYSGTGSDKDTNALNLPYMHAYACLGTVQLSDGTKLVKMRNPWGHELYSGPWSDYS